MTTTLPVGQAEQTESVLRVFRESDVPLTLANAKKAYRGPKLGKNDLPQLVHDLLMRGELFECSPSGKSPRYWTHDEEQRVREAVEAALAGDPLPESKLVTAVGKELGKVSTPNAIKKCILAMKAGGQLYELPAKGKAKPLSLRPVSPLELVQLKPATWKDITATFATVASQGVSLEEFLSLIARKLAPTNTPTGNDTMTPTSQNDETLSRKWEEATDRHAAIRPEEEVEELILKGMQDIEPMAASGVPVSIRALRQEMPAEYQTHEVFDRAVLRLADQEKIVLHRHDHPASLGEAERDALVRDEYGNYFTVIAHRT